MTYQENPNPRHRAGMREDRRGWGIPIAIAAALLVGSLFYFNSDKPRTTTAANDPNRPVVTQPAPAPSPSTNPNPTR